MPKVNGKKFPYTPQGMQDAQAAKEQTKANKPKGKRKKGKKVY